MSGFRLGLGFGLDHRLSAYALLVWLLETGVWNDAGAWDDAASWKDM